MPEKKLLLDKKIEDMIETFYKKLDEHDKKLNKSAIWSMRVNKIAATVLVYLIIKFAGNDGILALQLIANMLTMGLI